MKKSIEKNTFVELVADGVKEALNKVGVDLRMDYDNDQTEKIEFGRKLARKVWRNL